MSEPPPAWREAAAPSLDDIATLAETAFAALPDNFRKLAGEVVFRVDDFPSEDVLEDLEIEDPFELTGLYTGLPVGSKSVDHSGAMPDMIHLYRRAILDEWVDTGVTLEALVSHVVIHEIGHHFGLSDEDMHALEEMVG